MQSLSHDIQKNTQYTTTCRVQSKLRQKVTTNPQIRISVLQSIICIYLIQNPAKLQYMKCIRMYTCIHASYTCRHIDDVYAGCIVQMTHSHLQEERQ